MTQDRIRAAALPQAPKLKRFYTAAGIVDADGGFAVVLDGRAVKTPKRRPLVLPTRPLAEAVAAEWAAQEVHVEPASMPLTQIANTAIDGVAEEREAVLDSLRDHAEADLLCYRAAYPDSLVMAQTETWQPLLDWAENVLGARLRVTKGIVAVDQPEESLAALRAVFCGYDFWRLTAAHVLAAAFGSVVLALAVVEGRLAAAAAFAVSRLDETHQAAIWGEDAEAALRAAAIAREVEAAAVFAALAAASVEMER